MLEIIKEAGAILKDLPDLAIWILVGILFYKTIIIGSVFGIIKLAINKTHDYLTKPKEVITKVSLNDRFITFDGTYDRFLDFLDIVVKDNGGINSNKGRYLHSSDVEFIKSAYIQARDSLKERKK